MSTINDISSSGVSSDAPNQISELFSDYQELPSSGFNRLFKAKKYGKWYVLKGLKPEYASQPFYRDLLLKEFELGVQLDHVNIVRIIDFETNPVVGLCIVMEYVDGQTLSEFLKTKPTSTVRLKVVSELLDGMAYYHGKQITHRDLKPSNILITYNGNNVKIIDFGLSDSDSHSILKQPAGTAKYAAPEQLQGDTVIDCRADIYAFGLILRLIFPHKYRRIVNKCTQSSRENRYDNIGVILKVFFSVTRFRQRIPLMLAIVVISLLLVLLSWQQLVINSIKPVDVVSDTLLAENPINDDNNPINDNNNQVNIHDYPVVKQTENSTSGTVAEVYTTQEQAYIDYAQKVADSIAKPVIDSVLNATYKYQDYTVQPISRVVFAIDKRHRQMAEKLPRNSLFYHRFKSACVIMYGDIYQYLSQIQQKLPSLYESYKAGSISEAEYDSISSSLYKR